MRLEAAKRRLVSRGFDVVHPFRVSWYNQTILEKRLPVKPLPTDGDDARGALLVGNSRALWEPFLRWLKAFPDGGRQAIRDEPVDTYSRKIIQEAINEEMGATCDFYWSADTGDRLVAMQRAAEASGLAYLDTNTHLSVHGQLGAWFSLRAVVVLPGSASQDLGIPRDRPPAPPNPLSEGEVAEAQRTMAVALKASEERTLCEDLHGPPNDTTRKVWQHWVAVRDVVRLGRETRFCDEQVEYHYTKNPEVLQRAVDALR